MDSMYVIEYSKNQDCFHITTLKDAIENNKRMFDNHNNNDYQIIVIKNNIDEAYKELEEIKKGY